MRKTVCFVFAIILICLPLCVQGAEYSSAYATIEIEEVPDEQFYIDAFGELARNIAIVSEITNMGYEGTPLDEDGNILKGWAYCSADLLDSVVWYGGSTYSAELLDADSYLYFDDEMVVERQTELNPFSSPLDFGYVTFKMKSDGPSEMKAWMYSVIVIHDTERDITYNYHIDVFDGGEDETVLLPAGVYTAYYYTTYVSYETSSSASFVVAPDRIAYCQLINTGAELNEDGIVTYEGDVLGEAYEWESTEKEDEEIESVEVIHINEGVVYVGNDDVENDEGETDGGETDVGASDNEPETNHDSGENAGGADSSLGINLSGAEIFNMLSAGLMIFTIYWYFFRKKRKKRGLRF